MVRTAAIALGSTSTVLCILTAAAFSRTRRFERELAEARGDVARLSERAESLATGLAGVEGELHKLRLAHVDTTPENRGAARAEEQGRRGEQTIARLRERADPETPTKGIRVLAESFRAGPEGGAAGEGVPSAPLACSTKTAETNNPIPRAGKMRFVMPADPCPGRSQIVLVYSTHPQNRAARAERQGCC